MSRFRWFKYLASNLLTGCTKIVTLLCLLGGCSPAPETERGECDLAAEGDNPDSYSQDLLEEGWRKGKLEIRFELVQAANTMESTSNGGKNTSVWNTVISAHMAQDVLVVPDLRVLVPDSGSKEERRSAMESSPNIPLYGGT